jgi:hypothetical protein
VNGALVDADDRANVRPAELKPVVGLIEDAKVG